MQKWVSLPAASRIVTRGGVVVMTTCTSASGSSMDA